MGRVGATGFGVDEELGVAVVGGDDPVGSVLFDGLVDTAKLGVDALDGADGGLDLAGVADHVGVGEVDDDDVEGGVGEGLDDDVGDALGGHLRGEVVGGDFLGLDELALFAGEGLFDAAVEKVGDVGVLFGLGDAEVAEVVDSHDVGEEVVHALGRDYHGELELGVVLGHGGEEKVFGDGDGGDFEVELGGFGEAAALVGGEAAVAGEDAGDLSDAVGAVVEADDGVVGGDEADWGAGGVGAGEGLDELVGDAVVVAFADAGDGVGVAAAGWVSGDHGAEGLGFLLPAVVAVHGVVAAADAGELAGADLGELLVELFEIACAAGGEGVAAVEEGVDVDALEVVLRGHAEEGVEVSELGVDAAVGDEADEVQGVAALGCVVHGLDEGGVLEELAGGDGGVDAGDVHADDAAGAEVEVADFGVAHLAVGEADEVVAGADEGVGVVAEESVVGGLARKGDGVGVGFGAVSPAVEDGQDDRWFGSHAL